MHLNSYNYFEDYQWALTEIKETDHKKCLHSSYIKLIHIARTKLLAASSRTKHNRLFKCKIIFSAPVLDHIKLHAAMPKNEGRPQSPCYSIHQNSLKLGSSATYFFSLSTGEAGSLQVWC